MLFVSEFYYYYYFKNQYIIQELWSISSSQPKYGSRILHHVQLSKLKGHIVVEPRITATSSHFNFALVQKIFGSLQIISLKITYSMHQFAFRIESTCIPDEAPQVAWSSPRSNCRKTGRLR
jgi:hypothetical protein